MKWLFSKPKEYKELYNEAYLLAVFSPQESLEKLKRHYNSMKKNPRNNKELKAKMAGFLAGLEARNKSRLENLEKLSQRKEKDELER